MTTRRKRFVAFRASVVVTVALAAVACGGSEKASAPSTSKASKPKRTTSTSTTPSTTSTSTSTTSTSSVADGAGAEGTGPSQSDQAAAQKAPGLCGRVSYETVVAISGDPAVQGEETVGDNPEGIGTTCRFHGQDGQRGVVLSLYRPDEKRYADTTVGQNVVDLGVPAKFAYEAFYLTVDTPEGVLVISMFDGDARRAFRVHTLDLAREFLASA